MEYKLKEGDVLIFSYVFIIIAFCMVIITGTTVYNTIKASNMMEKKHNVEGRNLNMKSLQEQSNQ